jgi:hypothetical protein
MMSYEKLDVYQCSIQFLAITEQVLYFLFLSRVAKSSWLLIASLIVESGLNVPDGTAMGNSCFCQP